VGVPLKVIQVQRAPSVEVSTSWVELLTTLCYYYPQYTLAHARRLPHKYVIALLKTARRMEAQKYHNLTQIAAAPHTKNGEGVKTLISHFEEMTRG
jgi:hypothetical protein